MPTVEHVGVSRKIRIDEERRRLKRHPEGVPPGARRRGASLPAPPPCARAGGLRARRALSGRTWDEVRAVTAGTPRRCCCIASWGSCSGSSATSSPTTSPPSASTSSGSTRHAGPRQRVAAGARPARAPPHSRPADLRRERRARPSSSGRCAPRSGCESGGYLVIDETEALVAMDVDTRTLHRQEGPRGDDPQDNLEAAREIARQSAARPRRHHRLDFIDMEERTARR